MLIESANALHCRSHEISNLVTSIDNVFSLFSISVRIRDWLERFWEEFWEKFWKRFWEKFWEKFWKEFWERFWERFWNEFWKKFWENENDALERNQLIYVDENWLMRLTKSIYATYWLRFISQTTTIFSISAHSTHLFELFFIQHCLLLIRHSWQKIVTSLFWTRMFQAMIKCAALFLRAKSALLRRDILNETMIWWKKKKKRTKIYLY
jgi:hypothetical protein